MGGIGKPPSSSTSKTILNNLNKEKEIDARYASPTSSPTPTPTKQSFNKNKINKDDAWITSSTTTTSNDDNINKLFGYDASSASSLTTTTANEDNNNKNKLFEYDGYEIGDGLYLVLFGIMGGYEIGNGYYI